MKERKPTEEGAQPEESRTVEESPIRTRGAEERARRRPERIPVATRSVLKYPKRPGYVRRVVNDKDSRIDVFLDAGYEIVTSDARDGIRGGDPRAGDAAQIGSAVSKPVGGNMRGVLMEIPEDWYKEDQKKKQEHIDSLEADMRRETKKEGQYGKIQIGDSDR